MKLVEDKESGSSPGRPFASRQELSLHHRWLSGFQLSPILRIR